MNERKRSKEMCPKGEGLRRDGWLGRAFMVGVAATCAALTPYLLTDVTIVPKEATDGNMTFHPDGSATEIDGQKRTVYRCKGENQIEATTYSDGTPKDTTDHKTRGDHIEELDLLDLKDSKVCKDELLVLGEL